MLVAAVLAAACAGAYALMMWMPGKSYRGPTPTFIPELSALRDALRRDVEELAGSIGERNLAHPGGLDRAADYLETSLAAAGYTVRRHAYDAGGRVVANLEAEITGSRRPDEIVVVGAHYDSVEGSPGANDNAGQGALRPPGPRRQRSRAGDYGACVRHVRGRRDGARVGWKSWLNL